MPACSRGHGGRVASHGFRARRDGRFLRRRFRCLPDDGSPSHTFTVERRTPTHLHDDGVACPHCDRPADRTSGTPIRPSSTFAVLDVATLLAQLGEGASLRDASRRRRLESGIRIPGVRPSRQNALAADYLDVLGPVVAKAVRPEKWPRFLILDSMPLKLRVRDPEAIALGVPYGTEGGAVLVASGKDDPALAAQPWLARYSGSESAPAWFDFLSTNCVGSPPPDWIVADGAKAISAAVAAIWPTTQVYPCEYHLRENVRQAAMADGLLVVPAVAAAIDTCLWSEAHWDRLRVVVAAHPPLGHLWNWMTLNDALCRGLEAIKRRFPAGAPRGNGPAEWACRGIDERLDERKRNFRNAARLDTVIGLMCADLAGVGGVSAYARILRTELAKSGWALPAGWESAHDKASGPSSVAKSIVDAMAATKAGITASMPAAQSRSVNAKAAAINASVGSSKAPLVPTRSAGVATASVKVRGKLVSDFPHLVAEWDPANSKTPQTTKAGSSDAAKWICSTCGYRWETPVYSRTTRLTGCRVCRRKWCLPHESLTALRPDLLPEWDAAGNGTRTPDRTKADWRETVVWKCATYPDLHPPYTMSPRTRAAKPIGCPICRQTARARSKRRPTTAPSNAP